MTPDHGFDWVKARSDCSPAKVFNELRLGAIQDTKSKNDTLSSSAGYRFDVQANGDIFSVIVQGNRLLRGVDFVLNENGISVRKESGVTEATLTLNDEGECRLKVGDKELECWQFRKLALEELLFTNPWPVKLSGLQT